MWLQTDNVRHAATFVWQVQLCRHCWCSAATRFILNTTSMFPCHIRSTKEHTRMILLEKNQQDVTFEASLV